MKKPLFLLGLTLFTLSVNGQTVPTNGKKTIQVKESFEGEYNQEVREVFYPAPYKQHMKRLPKKLKKYGFTNVVVTKLGEVRVTDGWANKLSKLAGGNDGVGRAKLAMATTASEISSAVDQIFTADPPPTKFQANFTSDQGTFKVRLSTFVGVKYIIKESNIAVAIVDGVIVKSIELK